MADTVAPTITATEHIQNFIRGIELRDVKLVEEALKAKVSPLTSIGEQFNPLFYLLATKYERSSPDIQNAVTPEQYAENTSKLVELLFQYGAKAAEQGRETREHRTLMDSVILSDHFIDASTVLLHAIKETLDEKRPVYKPDIRGTVHAIVEEAAHEAQRQPDSQVNVEGSARNVIDTIERLHNVVRARLSNPQTELEKEIVDKYAPAIQHYLAPFARPNPSTIAEEVVENADEGLRRSFSRETARNNRNNLDKYLYVIDKRDPADVLKELGGELVGLDNQKDALQKLVYSQMLRSAAGEAGIPTATKNYSEAIMGPDGIGKTTLARRKAELLVSLGLAGPTYVEFTKENSSGPSINLSPEALARVMSRADIIHLEIPEIDYNPRNPMADFGLRMIAALKASLEDRKDPPVILLTGLPDTLKDIFESNSTLETVIPKFTRLDDMPVGELGKAFDQIAAAPGLKYDVSKDARDLVIEALDGIKRSLGKEFTNVRGVQRLIDAFEDQIAERLFSPNPDGTPKPMPKPEDLKKVLPEDIKALNTYALLAGPALAKRNQAGFHNRPFFNS